MKQRIIVALGAVTLAGLVASAPATGGQAVPFPGHSGLLEIVREATADYRDVEVAEAAGYALATPCTTGQEEGAMGFHWGNPDLILDGELDAQEPELLMYERKRNGSLRLVGAEFLVLAQDWDDNHEGPPALHGHLFHYTGSPNRYRLPPFYELHVWAWARNRCGLRVRGEEPFQDDATPCDARPRRVLRAPYRGQSGRHRSLFAVRRDDRRPVPLASPRAAHLSGRTLVDRRPRLPQRDAVERTADPPSDAGRRR